MGCMPDKSADAERERRAEVARQVLGSGALDCAHHSEKFNLAVARWIAGEISADRIKYELRGEPQ